MKKILALVLAFALCFTAVAGCITTSAEDAAAAPAIEISNVELANTAGATSFTVSGTNCETVAAQQLTVTIAEGVTLDSIYNGATKLIDADTVATGDDADYYVETVDGNTVVTLVSVLNIGAANDAFTYKFNVTVPENNGETAVDYDVTATTVAGSIDEEYINVEIAPAKITVAAKVVAPQGPVLDPSLEDALYNKTVQITSKVGTFFTLYMPDVDFDDFEFVVSKPAMGAPSYTFTGASVDKTFNPTNYGEGSSPEDKLFTYSYADIALYEMNSKVTCTLYIIKNGQKVSYYTWDQFTVAELVKINYQKNVNNAVNAGLAVAVLNLGTDAQVHFAAVATKNGYPDNSLSKAPALNTDVNQELVPEYGELPTYTTQKDAAIFNNTVQILAAPSLRYTVYDENMTEVCKNPANVTISASYSSTVLGDVVTTVNGAALSAEDIESANDGLYTFTFSDVALYDANEVVTFTFSGTDSTSYSCKSTLMTLIANNINATGTAGDVYRSLATVWVASSNKFK